MDSLRRVSCLIGSSNSLLCVALDFEKDDTVDPLLLLNPATREIRQVPRSTDEDCSYCYYGFGYSPVVRDYKIVRIHSAGARTNIRRMHSHNIWVEGADVYSLRTGSWKEVYFGDILGASGLYSPVAFNGDIFWIGREPKYHRHVIICFDLEMEFFELIPIPSSNSALPHSRYVLDTYEDKLILIHEYLHALEEPQYPFIDLWVLEEGSGCAYGQRWGWSKKYSITPNRPSLHPIRLWGNEIVCTNGSDPFFLFHLAANNELKKFHTSLSKGDVYEYGFFFYAESLVTMCDTDLE